ncbi:MAG: RNA polymerase sigma factor [Breznakibacter sp.]
MKRNDKELLVAIAAGDSKAFTEFYERHHRIVYRKIASRIGDKEEAEDLFQQFWTLVWSQPGQIMTDETESAIRFMHHLLSKRILDYFRSVRKQAATIDHSHWEEMHDESLHTSHIMEDLLASEIMDLVTDIVASLPEMERKVYELRFLYDYSVSKTAELLEISEKTVYNKLSLALKRIRIKLKPVYYPSATEGVFSVLLVVVSAG